MLTVILFTFWPEEKEYISAALESVKWANEIIVIDNGADADTLNIVRKYTDKIYPSSSTDFSQRHNLGKEKAGGDWLLYLDADERVSATLREEMQKELKNPQYCAYKLRRVNFFLGKEVRYGDRYPDYLTRLFKKDKLKGWSGEIHETSRVDGPIGELYKPLYHLTHRDIYTMMAKTINFSDHEAKLRFANNHPPVSWWRLLRIMATEFWQRFIKYQAWRQGTEGWLDGLFQVFSFFIVYVRLWELQRKEPLAETYRNIDKKILAAEI